MRGWRKGEEGIGCKEERAHRLCFFKALARGLDGQNKGSKGIMREGE